MLYLYVALCLFLVLLGAFRLSLNSALQWWGRHLAGLKTVEQEIEDEIAIGKSELEAKAFFLGKSVHKRGVMDEITPAFQVNTFMLQWLGVVALSIFGGLYFKWYIGIAVFLGIRIASFFISKAMPRYDANLYRNIIRNDLIKREQSYKSKDDLMRSEACRHFIENMIS